MRTMSYEQAKAEYERKISRDAWVDRALFSCFGVIGAVIAMEVL